MSVRRLGRGMRGLYNGMEMALRYHAEWEKNVARTIFSSRKRLTILGLMCLPLLLIPILLVAHAAELPMILGGKKAYAPILFFTIDIFFAAALIGFAAGLVTGAIGMGGGWVLTPALMSIGVRGIIAVGSDLFHIFAKAILGTTVHQKLGNVNWKLAIPFVVGSVAGASIGGMINRYFYDINPLASDAFITCLYIAMLGFLAFYTFGDSLRLRKMEKKTTAFNGGVTQSAAEGKIATTGLALKIQNVRLPGMVRFDEDIVPGGKQIWFGFVTGTGFLVGITASTMGVGGGFLTFPMYMYLLGVSTFTTVGTDIAQIILTAGYSSIFQYAIYGYIFYTLEMGLLVGSLIGIQLGALTTKVTFGRQLRFFYGVAMIGAFTNRLLDLPGKLVGLGYLAWDPGICKVLSLAGGVIFFSAVGIAAAYILSLFIRGVGKLREIEVEG